MSEPLIGAPRLGPATPPPHIVIFADGACSGNPGPGGWGSIIALPDGRVAEIGDSVPKTTNNRMELTAAIKALKAASRVEGPVHVYTDSVYVIRGITAWIHGWRRNGWKTATGDEVINSDLWQELFDVAMRRGESRTSGGGDSRRPTRGGTGAGITWHYVRGHAGIPGNERCDRLAVAFSKREDPALFRGQIEAYRVPVLSGIPEDTSVPDRRPDTLSSGRPKFKAFYISLLDGQLERHVTWDECKSRVDGRPGARFKKISSPEEESETLRKWGVAPSADPRG